jgi:hypothetical protein
VSWVCCALQVYRDCARLWVIHSRAQKQLVL